MEALIERSRAQYTPFLMYLLLYIAHGDTIPSPTIPLPLCIRVLLALNGVHYATHRQGREICKRFFFISFWPVSKYIATQLLHQLLYTIDYQSISSSSNRQSLFLPILRPRMCLFYTSLHFEGKFSSFL